VRKLVKTCDRKSNTLVSTARRPSSPCHSRKHAPHSPCRKSARTSAAPTAMVRVWAMSTAHAGQKPMDAISDECGRKCGGIAVAFFGNGHSLLLLAVLVGRGKLHLSIHFYYPNIHLIPNTWLRSHWEIGSITWWLVNYVGVDAARRLILQINCWRARPDRLTGLRSVCSTARTCTDRLALTLGANSYDPLSDVFPVAAPQRSRSTRLVFGGENLRVGCSNL
jgi:hypothetical protein